MKQLTLSFLLALLPLTASADAVEIDGIWYNLVKKAQEAEVTQIPNGKYSGQVDIPASVAYEGVNYSVTSIKKAFLSCGDLTSVTIPNSVTNIAESAFSGCTGLASVTIPNSVISIGDGAFSWCSNLTSVTIPNSVTSIGENAFSWCSSLTSVTIGNSVKSIGRNAFYECNGLTSVTIGNSVTSIGAYAFESCSDLSSVTIPNSVKSIDACAFRYCSGLTSVTIPNSVTSIGVYSFSGCSGLTSVTIGSVWEIESYAFQDCSNLTSVTLFGMATRISNQAFANCENLTDFYCLAETMDGGAEGPKGLQTSSDAFLDSYPQYITLHVPASAINAYKTTGPWSGFKEIVPISGEQMQKCATPTISIENGKVKFNCETEGAEFVSTISTLDAKNYYDSELTLSYKYKVSVYATKAGYENSDTATLEITASGIFGDLNKDGEVNVADHVELTKIIMGESQE